MGIMNLHEDIIDRYQRLLASLLKSLDKGVPKTDDEHLYWMLEEINTLEDSHKAHRWIGYVQGVMVMKGYISVDEERDFTRGYFTK